MEARTTAVVSRGTNTALLPIALARCLFEAEANVHLHFREVDKRSYFFFPAPFPHRDGQWIFVEFVVAGSEVPCLARGRVRVHQNAKFPGSWLEFPTLGLSTIIANSAKTRRAQKRLPVDVTATVRSASGARLVCRISDVSKRGVRLSGLHSFLNVGENISIELVGLPRAHSDLGKGRVTWVRSQEAGIHLAGSRNGSLAKLVEDAAAARNSAIEFVHTDSCPCRNGERPLEPVLPAATSKR